MWNLLSCNETCNNIPVRSYNAQSRVRHVCLPVYTHAFLTRKATHFCQSGPKVSVLFLQLFYWLTEFRAEEITGSNCLFISRFSFVTWTSIRWKWCSTDGKWNCLEYMRNVLGFLIKSYQETLNLSLCLEICLIDLFVCLITFNFCFQLLLLILSPVVWSTF